VRTAGQLPEHGRGLDAARWLAKTGRPGDHHRVGAQDELVPAGSHGASLGDSQPADVRRRSLVRSARLVDRRGADHEREPGRAEQLGPAW
jgi:hypothetical protein